MRVWVVMAQGCVCTALKVRWLAESATAIGSEWERIAVQRMERRVAANGDWQNGGELQRMAISEWERVAANGDW